MDSNDAPVSLTPASDPRPNDRRVFSPKRFCWTEKDWPNTVDQGEVTANRNGTLYTPGQQAVLRDTMGMLRMHFDAPSPEEFKTMNPGEQGQIVKKFLGTKSLGIFIRNMNAASQIRVSVDSANNVGPMIPSLQSANSVPPPISRTRLQDIWLQRIAAHGNAATGVHSAGKFNTFLETRNWDARVLADQVSSQPLSTTESFTTVDGGGTSPSKHLDVSGDQFFQLLNDYYQSAPADNNGPGDGPIGLRQRASARSRAAEGNQRPDGLGGMARENSDLRVCYYHLVFINISSITWSL